MHLNCGEAEIPILLTALRETHKRFKFIAADCHPHLWKDNTVDDLVSYVNSC
jgi:hypothetical protein